LDVSISEAFHSATVNITLCVEKVPSLVMKWQTAASYESNRCY